MHGLLNSGLGGGLLGGGAPMIRQIRVPMNGPLQPSPFMGMAMGGGGQGGPPAYGSDDWATQTGGPGAMIWREMFRAMASNKGGSPLGFLDPKTKAFSPWLRDYLGPQFQKGK